MITIYSANAADFSTLGLGALSPSACMIEEQAGGLYEMTLTQPITDDLKHTLIAQGRIVKAPAPVRETPLVEIGKSGSVVRRICKVTTDGRRLSLRTAASPSARVIHAYRPGTEVAVTGESGSWSSVIILDGGASGWMWTGNLTFVREESETISGDAPGSVIAPRQTREQLFRICEVETDGERRAVTARAQHISYDLKGAIVARAYAPENVSAETVCAAMMGYIDHETPFRLICTVTEPVTIDCTGRNILDIIMDRDSGLLAQTGARLIRDNYDLFLLPDEARERGVSLRYGKNLLSAVLRTDASGLITRIQPAGKAKDGETLLINDDPAQSFVDSARIGDYPAIYARRVEYDVVEGKDLTKAEAREKLREKALSDFDAGCDLPSIRLDADFVRLDLTEDYKALANAYALHLYDSVPVTDDAAGIVARARMTGYKYDALLGRYDGTTLGELTDAQATVYGDEIGGGLSGTKIIPGSMGGDRLRNLSVNYAKISRAAVDQLSADSLTAQIAHINALTAGTVDADALTAAWAKMYTIIAENIEAGTIEAGTITAAMAKLSGASIQRADIDFAQIRQMKAGTAVADQLITHDAVADRYFIDKLQVRALQVLEQTVGSLIVKAKDGGYYRLDIDPGAGTVVPTPVSPSGGEKAAGVTGDMSRCIIETDLTVADLAASNIKAINALIDKLTASRIEVDTLFAREATVGALNAYLLKAETIEALQGQLNIWASDKITAAVSGVEIGGTNLLHGISVWGIIDGEGFGYDLSGASAMGTYVAQNDGSLLVTNSGSNLRVSHSGLAVHQGEVYTVSAEYKDVSGECAHQFQMIFLDSSGAFVGNAVSEGDKTTLADGWVKSVFTFTIPEGAAKLAPCLRSGTDYTLYTHQYYIRHPKLERGNKATDWSPNPNELRDVRVGSNILMDTEHTEISTPYLDIDVSGTEGDMHIDENGISAGTATFETLNCPDVVKSTGSAIYSGGLQEAFNALNGRFLTGDVTISLSADQYGTFMLKGVYGVNASINIVGNGHSINGALAVYNCKLTNVGIGGVTINGNGSSTPLVLIDAGFVSVIGVTVNGGGAGTAVDANYGTRLMMYDNGLYNAGNLIRLGHCTEGSLVQLRGGSCTNYLRADGARWTMSGTRPDGTYAQENTCLHAPENPDSLTIDYGMSQPPVTPVTTTSYTASVTGTYYPSGHWMSSNQMIQGRYDSTRYYGCMWFGASALSGKTIKSATLTIKRIAGAGKSSAVNVTLYTSPVTGKSGNPTTGAVSLGTLGKAANGESVIVTLPTSAIGVIAAGGALMLDPGDTANASNKRYSANYARFEGKDDGTPPVLTVTYQ